MNLLWLIIPACLAGISLYYLLPALLCAFDRKLANTSLASLTSPLPGSRINRTEYQTGGQTGSQTEDQTKGLRIKSDKITDIAIRIRNMMTKVGQRLYKAGYESPPAIWIYLASQTVLPLLLLLLVSARGVAAGAGGSSPTMLSTASALLPAVLVNIRITGRIADRRKAFTRSLYKIYRFLDLQLSAGIKMSDALRGLPETVQDPRVYPIWVRFSALYELTLNLDAASDLVRRAFGGADCELLATHLRQCMQTGQAGRSLKRMEELLFTRFFGQLQQETKQIRAHLMITACLGLIPAVIAFLYPMIHDATKALQSVFG